MSDIAIAAVLAGTILLASALSVELGLSVALIELLAGAVVGNALSLSVPGWLAFVGSFAGLVLAFLAGTEVDVPQFRREWRADLWIGGISFAAPFAAVALLAYYGLGWNHRQAEIAGIALSTTSLAVVYAALVETELNRTTIGKRLMSATFVTDLGTATTLSILFIKPTLWITPFVAVPLAFCLRPAEDLAVVLRPVRRPRDRARDQARLRLPLPADVARGPRAFAPVLPAFVLGLVMSSHYVRHRTEQERVRVVGFAFLTPFFFALDREVA
jgi:Kef-type K+ transport system membrane component KefB